MAANNRVLILTGGPGPCKTFSVRTIIALWKAMGEICCLLRLAGLLLNV